MIEDEIKNLKNIVKKEIKAQEGCNDKESEDKWVLYVILHKVIEMCEDISAIREHLTGFDRNDTI